MPFQIFAGFVLMFFVNDAQLLEILDKETVNRYSQMLSSCVCKLNGDIYNLTTLGNAGKSPHPRVLSFRNTRDLYLYFFNLCYPFSWPPSSLDVEQLANVEDLTQRYTRYKKMDEYKTLSELDVHPCVNASLCQFNVASELQAHLPFFKAVTTQSIDNRMLRCYYNKTIDRVQWIYKGVGRIFKTGGMVLTLICDENQDIPDFQTQYDVDRNKGNPWKYISVRHKCCCPNKCSYGGHSSKQKFKKERLALELGAAGGGFLVLFIIMLLACKIQEHFYSNHPPLAMAGHPSPKANYGTFLPKMIPYEEINDLRQIGEGAFGIVSKARWRNSDVAVKRIKEHVIDEDIEPFIRESIWMSKLPHHNIVQFYGVCVLKPNLCIITEYMEGGSVADIIHKKCRILSSDTRIKWAIDAAKGMTYLHSQTPPIIHRDLKSDNLLVDENGLVKIADFGAVKLLEPIFARHHNIEAKNENHEHARQEVNCNTLLAGTLRWSAPEAIPMNVKRKLGKRTMAEYTPASDVYSFGITVWEMVSNKRPYYDILWDHKIVDAIENGIRPDTLHFPRDIKEFINRCWHGNPHVRPTFEDILKELNYVKRHLESSCRLLGPRPSFMNQLRYAPIQAL